jgi:peptidoglycan/LPS O-acetylase OafA/YrhL
MPGTKESNEGAQPAVALAWVFGAIAVVASGFEVDGYLAMRDQPQVYPFETVRLILVLMAIEAGVLAGLLRPGSYRRAWGRAAFAAVGALAWSAFVLLTAMHMPPCWGTYWKWTFALAVALAGLAIFSGVAAWRARRSRPSA